MLLCDDAQAFSILLEHWVSEIEDIEVVAVTGKADEATELAGELRPDVIVLDHMLRTTTSEQLVPCLRSAAPDSRILLISGMAPQDLEKAAVASGVDGFASKASTPQAMCQAIRDAAASDRG